MEKLLCSAISLATSVIFPHLWNTECWLESLSPVGFHTVVDIFNAPIVPWVLHLHFFVFTGSTNIWLNCFCIWNIHVDWKTTNTNQPGACKACILWCSSSVMRDTSCWQLNPYFPFKLYNYIEQTRQVVHLDIHLSKSLPTFATKKLWFSENIDQLLNILEETDWSSLPPSNDVHSQATVFTSYVNFCIDEWIPTVPVRERNDKPWMNGKIPKLIADWCRALSNNDTSKVRQLQSVIQKEMRHAKFKHARSVEDSLKSEPSQAWKSLNSLLKLKTKPADCNLDAEELNMYYDRFEKFSDPPFLPRISVVSDFFLCRRSLF